MLIASGIHVRLPSPSTWVIAVCNVHTGLETLKRPDTVSPETTVYSMYVRGAHLQHGDAMVILQV